MEKLRIDVKRRDGVGKKYAGIIRRKGIVPAILYKKGVNIPIELKEADLVRILHEAHSESFIAEIHVVSGKGEEIKTAILKDVEHDVIKGRIIHVDFQEISLDEIIKIKVPLEIKGEPVGVKRDGGVLDHLLREVEIECKASEVMSKIEINVDNMQIGDSLHLSDLSLPPGVKLTGDSSRVFVHVVAPREEMVEEKVESEVAQEPEVIKERKPKEEEPEEPKKKGAEQ
ncbi:MAG: 50S ribosomal protein L25 [Candidatus Omnitrophica bacterium]|nr:50S ribosomal protein L25 [Candidatus Omnitrophota bacterium]